MTKLPDKSYYEEKSPNDRYSDSFDLAEKYSKDIIPSHIQEEFDKAKNTSYSGLIEKTDWNKVDTSGRLYPSKLYNIYHVVMVEKKIYPGAEELCDKIIKKFLDEKSAEIGMKAYYKNLITSISPLAKKLTRLRAVVATFGLGEEPRDNMPRSYRSAMLQQMGRNDQSYDQWMTELESASKHASVEDLILGRIGYMALWYSIQNKEKPDGYLEG